MRSIKLLLVGNKGISETDFRYAYFQMSDLCSVTYALPEKTKCLNNAHYLNVKFKEGFRLIYLIELVRLAKYLRKNRSSINIVHFYSTVLFLLGPFIARIAGIPSIITINGFGRTFSSKNTMTFLMQRIYLFFLHISMSLAQRVLLQNYSDLAVLRKKFPYFSHKLAYIGSGIEASVVHEKDFYCPSVRVIHIARILPDKGIKDFLRVAKSLSHKGFEFILIGPASKDYPELLEVVKDYHNQGIINYKGELEFSVTLAELAKAHILFFPSYYGEGMSRVMLEAGFVRACPIAYDIPANRDLIVRNQGFLHMPGDLKT
jgi:glycosyltransferase involved in cell wall biosynthesis